MAPLSWAAAVDPNPSPTAAPQIEIRLLAVRDSLQALTRLLHRAYAPLVERGMLFSAATQGVEVTARRAAQGQCFVAVRDREIVGTATVCGPQDEPEAALVPWFRDSNTAYVHQLAVAPEVQRFGVGARLVQHCEAWARENGYHSMVTGVAVGAAELSAMFRRLGYGEVGQVQGLGRGYRSLILHRPLDPSPLRGHLQTLARCHRWATERLLAAVDRLPEADYRRDAGLFFGSVHGTLNHLLVAEERIWLPRFAEGAPPQPALDASPDAPLEADRALLGRRLLVACEAWLPLIAHCPEARLDGMIEYHPLGGEAVALPFAATLAHVFNHGTHHRGQISAALTAMGQPAPVLDMVCMLQEESRPR
jgi:uncharacterized damage-inducible protein DinB/GNAT superfamily N-acetyltransferase